MPGVGSHKHHGAWSALVAMVVMMLLVNGSMARCTARGGPSSIAERL